MTHSLVSELSAFVAHRLGLNFPEERWRDLERGLASTARELGFDSPEACTRALLSSPNRDHLEVLTTHLTVGESYFFREQRSLKVFSEHILPSLIRSRWGRDQRLRFWSAGCCRGEEPYTLAILIRQALPTLKDWDVTVLATDVNPRFLEQAKEGLYGEWAFRSTPPELKERYFRPNGSTGRYRIDADIKKMVTVAPLNLVEDRYPSSLEGIDVIFCRNVLMYFSPSQAEKVSQRFYRSLAEGGWLVVSPSETSQALFGQYSTVTFPDAVLYQKTKKLTPPAPPSAVAVRPPPEPRVPQAPPAEASQPEPYEVALTLFHQGRYPEAAEILRSLLSQAKADVKVMSLLARIHANQGELDEAMTCCDKALAANRLDAKLHYLRATILLEQSAPTEAAISFKRALYLEPDFVLAHFALGNLALEQGRHKEARRHFDNVLSLLKAYPQEATLPESDELTAGRLKAIVQQRIEGPPD